MSPKEIIESVRDERFQDEDGGEFAITLHPGLSEAEYQAFAGRFPVPPPEEIQELLRFTRGFDFAPVDRVDLRGELDFEDESIFPLGLPICGDGYGNFWVVDVQRPAGGREADANPESGAWAPIFYACHDPPVVAYQAATLAEFLAELFKQGRQDATNTVDHVHEQVVFTIWHENPGLVPATEARQSGDRVLRTFAEGLDERALIADLREPRIGSGFSWGRFGAGTQVQRAGSQLLFAITPPEKKGFFARLLGR